jgi:hypothetical protein
MALFPSGTLARQTPDNAPERILLATVKANFLLTHFANEK